MEVTSSSALQSISKLLNATQSVGKFVLPVALAATALFAHHTMALQAQPSAPPSLTSSGSSSLSLASAKRFEVPPATEQIHLVILVHGWLGSPSEMSSIQQALDNNIRNKDTPSSSNSLSEDSESPEEEEKNIPDGTFVLVHSVECNDGKTHDGVMAGGGRVGNEINQIIKELLGAEEDDGQPEELSDASVSLSFIGNSLGGLYARAALADVQWDLPNGKPLVPNIFCTTCTPHLGKRGLTYLPLPRFAELGIGHALKPTGQDLFGCNRVVEDLATQSRYLDPLKRFRKRILYANAFGTDLQVPTSTAAILADTESPHETQESNPPFLLKVTTPRDEKVLESVAEATSSLQDNESSARIPATTMARTLDALGWTKVFCDVRDKLVSVPVPFRGEEGSSEFTKKETWTSHELKAVIAARNIHDKKWPIPLGHTMLIANSKSDFYAKLNQGGLPFVKQLTSEFVDDLLNCT